MITFFYRSIPGGSTKKPAHRHITPLTTLQTRILELIGLSVAIIRGWQKNEESYLIYSHQLVKDSRSVKSFVRRVTFQAISSISFCFIQCFICVSD
jgi:hypothetical protein